MKKIIAFALLLFPVLAIGQTTTENYVKTTAYQVATQTTDVDDNQKIETITYYDGLGRAKQTVSPKAGGDKQNIVQLISYDSLGRTSKQYLPYATETEVSNPLNFTNQTILENSIKSFYDTSKYEDTKNPYSETLFEESPLNRPLRQGAPGNNWEIQKDTIYDHTVHYIYATNTVTTANRDGDDVLDFDVVFNGTDITQPSLELIGIHSENRLSKTIVQDENFNQNPTLVGDSSGPGDLQVYAIKESGDHATEEFINKKGQVILKRTYNEEVPHDTYYVYDDFGNLTFVLSPEASNQIINGSNLVSNAQEILDKLGYQYKYDYRNRLIQKKIPAKGWESIVYNKLDQPILTQDANQYAVTPQREWLFTKYDAFGRVIYTGIKNANISRNTYQNVANNTTAQYEERKANPTTTGGVDLYYTQSAVPTTFNEILTVNYYDTYEDLGGYNLPVSVYGQNLTTHTQGLPTVSKVRVLGTNDWITTVTGYDQKGRPIFVRSENTYLGTIDTSESLLDFTGKVLESRTVHQKSGHQQVVTKDFFTYDHQNRLITHMQQIDNEPMQLIASNSYDELGQLESKRVGGQLFESGYTNLVRVSVSEEGVITKTDNTESFNAGMATIGKLEGDGGLSFKMLTPDATMIIGLNDTNTSHSSPFDGNYLLRFDDDINGNGYLCRVFIRPLAGGSAIHKATRYYQDGDNTFAIEREGDNLNYIHNGEVFYSEALEDPSIPLIGDIGFSSSHSSISNLNFYATNINKSLQKVDYQYNIRGWLTDINPTNNARGTTDLFYFKINYDSPIEGDAGIAGRAKPLYNGNISQTIWRSANTDKQKRTYGYKYDALNRIERAYNYKGVSLDEADNYGIRDLNYDLNGNLLTLIRAGKHFNLNSALNMDDLSYNYDGNQLLTVNDSSTSGIKDQGFYDGNTSGIDYEYDVNGNMIKDNNKGITNITYNHLNLPTIISINGVDPQGVPQVGTINYVYDATGVKLEKEIINDAGLSTITSYAGGYIYENNNNVESLKMFPHPEGYVEPVYNTSKSIQKFSRSTQTTSFSNYQYAFNYTDHLGNVRLTYADSDGDGAIKPSAEIISEKAYYPFGLVQKGYNDVLSGNVNHTANRFGYGGKELGDELGLNWMDFDARNYDAALGRWMNIDPLADSYLSWSPYNYSFNSPIVFFDPTGLGPVYDKDGNLIGYEVEDGQGPTQIAEDLNTIGLQADVTYLDIVNSNPEKFEHIDDVTNINDEGFKKLDINKDDIISVSTIIERENEITENKNAIVELEEEMSSNQDSISALEEVLDGPGISDPKAGLLDGDKFDRRPAPSDPKSGLEGAKAFMEIWEAITSSKTSKQPVWSRDVLDSLKKTNSTLEKKRDSLKKSQ